MRGVTETAVWAGSGDIFTRGGGNTQEFLYAINTTRILLKSLVNLYAKQYRDVFFHHLLRLFDHSAVEEFLTTSLVFEC